MIGIGVDLCKVERIEQAMTSVGFLERYYTVEEREYITSRGKMGAQSAAAMFAAKEAFLKAVGCGIDGKIRLSDIGVSHEAGGAPCYRLTGAAEERLVIMGGQRVHLSLTHEDGMAAAVAIVE